MKLILKCNQCGELLQLTIHEENRRKATQCKKHVQSVITCKHLGYKCKEE